MATNSGRKLTKFESAVTIVTADFANALFGGLYATSSALSLEEDDPRVCGHIHDGERVDGHAGKIDLVYHVENQLTNTNLGDAAVTRRTVFCSKDVTDAIPEYKMVDGDKCYYLDLSMLRGDFTFVEDEDPAGDGTEHRLIRQRIDEDGLSFDTDEGFDFVVGSNSLDDLASAGTLGDHRLFFDKDKGSFRAGGVDSDQWDEGKRGDFSAAFGEDTVAAGQHSVVSGGQDNQVSSGADHSSIGGGLSNSTMGAFSTISGGTSNEARGTFSTVGGGASNEAHADSSTVSGGEGNTIDEVSTYSTIGGGFENVIADGSLDGYADSDFATISGGEENSIVGGDGSVISGGSGNKISSFDQSTVMSGALGEEIFSSDYSVIGGGGGIDALFRPAPNTIGITFSSDSGTVKDDSSGSSKHSVICGGVGNQIVGGYTGAGQLNFIGAGWDNHIAASNGRIIIATILSGTENEIISGPPGQLGIKTVPSVCNTILVGRGNKIISGAAAGLGAITLHNTIVSGRNNRMQLTSIPSVEAGDLLYNTILNGYENKFDHEGGGGVPDSFGAQTSSILGGTENIIWSNTFGIGNRTLTSTIVGGFKNEIQSSHGSVISGGGAVINPFASSAPPYNILGGTAGNKIASSHYCGIYSGSGNTIQELCVSSTILGGNDNLIANGNFGCSIPYGANNLVTIEFANGVFDQAEYSSAKGRHGRAWNFGQASQASGEFDKNLDPPFPSYTPKPFGGGTGSAQTFVMTAFGHWRYSQSQLATGAAFPDGAIATSFLASFDGGKGLVGGLGDWGDPATYGGDYGRHRGFRPRPGSAYSYEATIVFSCTDYSLANNSYPAASGGHEVVGLKYRGTIAINGDGTLGVYGCAPIGGNHLTPTNNVLSAIGHDFTSVYADTSENGSGPISFCNFNAYLASPYDFHIVFAPKCIIDNFSNSGTPVPSRVDWTDGGVGSAGSAFCPAGELSFAFYIQNRSGKFVGESVVARVEFVEVGLFQQGMGNF